MVSLGKSQPIKVVPWQTNSILIIAQNSKLCSYILRYAKFTIKHETFQVVCAFCFAAYPGKKRDQYALLRQDGSVICRFAPPVIQQFLTSFAMPHRLPLNCPQRAKGITHRTFQRKILCQRVLLTLLETQKSRNQQSLYNPSLFVFLYPQTKKQICNHRTIDAKIHSQSSGRKKKDCGLFIGLCALMVFTLRRNQYSLTFPQFVHFFVENPFSVPPKC